MVGSETEVNYELALNPFLKKGLFIAHKRLVDCFARSFFYNHYAIKKKL